MQTSSPKTKWVHYLFYLVFLVGLYFTTFVNYLLFHGLVEGFSIIVAFAFFAVAWNSKRYIQNQYILFIGVAYFFIASLDLLHTFSYKGMPIFTDYDFYANQLWIGARYMESLTLLIAFYALGREKSFKPEMIFLVYLIVTTSLVLSIFVWKIFPVCFIEGSGLTVFKKTSEYVISTILGLCILILKKKKNHFKPNIYRILVASLIFTIISELAFTFYISNYGISNLIGHYFKLFSFFLIYKAVIETGLRNPYNLIFRELDFTNKQLTVEIDARVKSEEKQTELIGELKSALSQVKALSGLLPICAHCKKIRDDKGYWKQIEAYIQENSEAKFSHGICHNCAQKHYSNYDLNEEE